MITVVCGPPCAGKTSYVNAHAEPGDLVVDFDALAQALGSPSPWDHPPAIAAAAHAAYRAVLRELPELVDEGNVWVVQARMTPGSRYGWQRRGARIVELDAEPAELHRRATAQGRSLAAHQRIDDWFRG